MADPALGLKMKLEVDDSSIPADIARAKAKVEASGTTGADAAMRATAATNQQAAATSALGEQLRKVKKTYGEQIEVVQGLIGKIAAVGAVATTFYKIGEVIGTQIVDKLTSAADKANDFLMTVNRADARAAIKQIADQVQALNAEIASTDEIQQQAFRAMAATGSPIGGLFAKDREKLIAERKILIDQLTGLSNRARGEQAKVQEKADAEAAAKERETQQKAASDLAAMTEAARRALMTDEERLEVEAQDKILAIIKAHNSMAAADRLAKAAETQAAIAAIERALADELERRAKSAADEEARKAEEERRKREQEADDLRRWYEEQERAAKRVQQAWTSSFRAIRDENNKAFASDQAASMVQFAQQLRIEGMAAQAGMNRIVVEGVQ